MTTMETTESRYEFTSDVFGEPVRWEMIPENLREGLDAYIMCGRPTGHFLKAFLSNDLKEAIARADDDVVLRLRDIMRFLYNCTPRGCFGSPEHYADWIKQGGWKGLTE